MGDELYGVSISKVKEIIKMVDIRGLQRAPGYVEGMANIRGELYIIYNLRKKLGMEARDFDENTRIVLITGRKIGFIVDEINEIIRLNTADIEVTNIPSEIKDESIEGIGKANGSIIVLLSLNGFVDCREGTVL